MSSSRSRVLVVADRERTVSALRSSLEDQGCEPLLAADGEAALRVVDARMPDAAVLDLRMPALDGWVLLALLGGRSARPKLVVCSASTKVEEQQRAFDLGADAFVPGPFDAQYVARTVREVLARDGAMITEARRAEAR